MHRSNTSRTVLKLMVDVSTTCKNMLSFINANIERINAMGIMIMVDKITDKECDEDTVEMLRRKGITRLPALIIPNGRPVIGMSKIVSYFDTNRQAVGLYDDASASYSGSTDLSDYWQRELYTLGDNGQVIPRADPDDDISEGSGCDFEKRMREYQTRAPPHRLQQSDRRRSTLSQPGFGRPSSSRSTARAALDSHMQPNTQARRRGGIAPLQTRPTAQSSETDDADNIGAPWDSDNSQWSCGGSGVPCSPPTPRLHNPRPPPSLADMDDMDSKILSAWMGKNPEGV